MDTRARRDSTKKKVIAIAAGCAVLGLGATATLAAWTDTEWVFGGDGNGGAGIGTSSFSIQQSRDGGNTWDDQPDNPGGEIEFAPDALDLTPGDSVYAGVALRTAAGSDAGDVTLQSAVAAAGIPFSDAGNLLFNALDVAIVTSATNFDCDEDAFAPGSPATLIGAGDLGVTGGAGPQTLAANSGSIQYYCFQILLPDPIPVVAPNTPEDYMGRTVAPAWEFVGISS